MKILAIESSCDETAAAVTEGREVLSNIVATQIAEHKIYGGVVPEIASRRHTEAISAVADEALKAAEAYGRRFECEFKYYPERMEGVFWKWVPAL